MWMEQKTTNDKDHTFSYMWKLKFITKRQSLRRVLGHGSGERMVNVLNRVAKIKLIFPSAKDQT